MSSNISFALNLQSEAGQKAIMARMDSELRVLENLRKFLNVQIKAGRDYSAALVSATGTAIKALTTEGGTDGHGHTVQNGGTAQTTPLVTPPLGGTRATSLSSVTDGVVSQVCLHVLEEVQSTAVNVKENSDFLYAQTLKELNELIFEKKLLVKGAHEEYARVKGRLDHFTELVNKCKGEYMKTHGSYELARTKYEDQCAAVARASGGSKSGGAGKRGDETSKEKEKFFRAKRRLNLAHAEYLLALHETTEYERDFRTILLPGILQVEQTWCEKEIVNWSDILEQIWNNGPPSLATVAKKLKDFEFSKEYLELISQYKCQPLQSSTFKFEPATVSSQPISLPTIIVDSSTLDFLRGRLTDTEKRLKLSEAQLAERTDQYSKLGTTLQSDLKSCEVSQARCDVERLQSLKNFLESRLNGIGTGPVPAITPTLSRKGDEISLLSNPGSPSGMKKSQGSAGNRFTTFFRTAAARTRKAVSFDEDSSSPLIPILNINNTKSTISNSILGSSIIGINLENEEPVGIVDRNMASLLEQDWFHGVLPREDVVRLLRVQGDFLVRETVKNDEGQIVLSVFWNGPKHFIVQVTPDGQFRFEGPFYPTVKELIEHYVKVKLPITNRSGAVIKKTVKRENWELNNDDVQLIEKIGRGNFGDVYKASYNGCLVAVKTCKVNLPEEQKKKFLQEGRILKQYDHNNIVRFVGICVQKQPIMIVMEIVSGGSLLTYLKSKGSSLTVRQTTKLCLDAAAGMKYLEERGCIHRDLAARNCLIDENTTVKISDFGMSREEHEYTVSDGMKQIPIKWTAPEALNYGKYTSLSDVWSYGILMWEIFAHGATPYSGMTNTRAREMIEAGYRMPATDGMPDVIYQLMTRCWQYEPEQRPRFSEIYSELEVIAVSDLI